MKDKSPPPPLSHVYTAKLVKQRGVPFDEVPEWYQRELHKRMQSVNRIGSTGQPWSEFKDELLKKHDKK